MSFNKDAVDKIVTVSSRNSQPTRLFEAVLETPKTLFDVPPSSPNIPFSCDRTYVLDSSPFVRSLLRLE